MFKEVDRGDRACATRVNRFHGGDKWRLNGGKRMTIIKDGVTRRYGILTPEQPFGARGEGSGPPRLGLKYYRYSLADESSKTALFQLVVSRVRHKNGGKLKHEGEGGARPTHLPLRMLVTRRAAVFCLAIGCADARARARAERLSLLPARHPRSVMHWLSKDELCAHLVEVHGVNRTQLMNITTHQEATEFYYRVVPVPAWSVPEGSVTKSADGTSQQDDAMENVLRESLPIQQDQPQNAADDVRRLATALRQLCVNLKGRGINVEPRTLASNACAGTMEHAPTVVRQILRAAFDRCAPRPLSPTPHCCILRVGVSEALPPNLCILVWRKPHNKMGGRDRQNPGRTLFKWLQ